MSIDLLLFLLFFFFAFFHLGVTSTPTANKGEWEVVLTALPARKLYLRQNDKGECTLFITINGKECVAESIFAKTVAGYVYDSCIFIEIVGRDANGNIQKEKVSP